MSSRSLFSIYAFMIVLVVCVVPASKNPAEKLAPEPTFSPAAEAEADWLARAREHIALREYWASENANGIQAPSRRHDLRTYFGPSGARVHDRTAPGSPALLELRLSRLGRGDSLVSVEPGSVTHAENRVEIERSDLLEWYLNGPEGLEQGFTLEKPPAGEGDLVLELAVGPAEARLRGEEIVLAAPTGRRLAYRKLEVFDANGASVPARFAVPEPGAVRLEVADAGFRYPLTIDPLLTGTHDTKLESNQVDAHMGFDVDGAGDVNGDGYADVIVGASGYDAGQSEEGAAFVFLGSAAGIADGDPTTAAAQLESDQANAYFGSGVAGAGDVNGDGYDDVIVGADQYDAGEVNEGAAFVFLGSASGIADGNPTTAAAQLESDQANALMAGKGAVAGAGDVNGDGYADVIVGASRYDAGQGFLEGAAFVFLGSASGIADGKPTTAATQLEPDQAGARLGRNVAGAGDVNGDGYADVIVGANQYDAGETDEGAAFVFLGSAAGIADGNPTSAAAQLEADQAGAYLGSGVAGAGDVNGDGYADVIVGASGYDAGETDEGAAFVFLGSAAGIADGNPTTAAAQIESDQASAYLAQVDGAGDVNGDGYADVIVSADYYDVVVTDQGAAFVFLGSASGIADGSPVTATAQLDFPQTGALLGFSVAGAGDVNGDGYADVIVGARNFDLPLADEGIAFVYLGGATGIASGSPATAAAQLEANQADGWLGVSVAGAGDVNGDGYVDVIVGAYRYDAGEVDEGAAFVFHGSASGVASGTPASAVAQLESDQSTANMGFSVAGAGDVNADGYADVFVGAPFYDAGHADEGAAFVFLGSAGGVADGTPATAAAQLESDQVDGYLGYSVAGAGDVNGDGYADVIVGAQQYDAGEANEGAAFVFQGSAAGIADGSPATAVAQLESDQVSAFLGSSVAGAGDVDGDGYADVVVGAPFYDAGQAEEGAAFVFLGSAAGILDGNPATAEARLESDQINAQMGQSVSGAGDLNGDGYADVIVGAWLYDAGESNEGAAFVFLGSVAGIADGSPATAVAQLESDQMSASFGSSVAGAGDVDGDGYADVIVGAWRYDAGEVDEGTAFLFLGSAAGIADGTPASAAAQLESDQTNSYFGYSVAGAGDVNGDGFSDVIVGSHLYEAGESTEGAAFVFVGNGGEEGRPVLARQLRGDGGGTPVEPWGASFHPDSFVAEITATHPGGRGRVKVEIEYCPAVVPFGDASCGHQTSANWSEVVPPTAGAVLSETISGLTTDTLYRWRARVLHAPSSVTAAGITPPPNPAHGPWRRVSAQAVEADIFVPEPGALGSLASGLALLGWLHQRRRKKSERRRMHLANRPGFTDDCFR